MWLFEHLLRGSRNSNVRSMLFCCSFKTVDLVRSCFSQAFVVALPPPRMSIIFCSFSPIFFWGREKCMALLMVDILPWLSWVRSLVQIMGKSSETEIGAFSRQISSILLLENLLASSIVLVASIDRPLISILFSRLPTGTMQSNMFHRKNVCGFFSRSLFRFSYSKEKNDSGREKKTQAEEEEKKEKTWLSSKPCCRLSKKGDADDDDDEQRKKGRRKRKKYNDLIQTTRRKWCLNWLSFLTVF